MKMLEENGRFKTLTKAETCSHCGKKFEHDPLFGWAYSKKQKNTERLIMYCSWGCMRAAEKEMR